MIHAIHRATYVSVSLFLLAVAAMARVAHGADPWIEAGFTDEGRESIRAAFKTAIDERLIAGGSLLLLKDDRPIFSEGFGYRNLKTKTPFGTDAIAHLASTSKPHTSTLLMMLVDDGLIDLDEPVSSYVDQMNGIKLKATGETVEAPTMRQLLSHTAGFASLAETGYGHVLALVFPRANFGESTAAITADGLAYRPGEDYRYTQLGMVVAAHVAETVSGKDFETLLEERLAGPIGATNTTWYPSQETLDAMAVRYDHHDGKLTPVSPPRMPRERGLPIDPAGSLVSDMDGVSRLFLLHKNRGVAGGKRLLSEEAIREMHALQPPATEYGLGLNLVWTPTDGTAPIVRHGGAFGTMGWADIETGIVGVIFIQTRPPQIPRWGELIYGALEDAGVGRMLQATRAATADQGSDDTGNRRPSAAANRGAGARARNKAKASANDGA